MKGKRWRKEEKQWMQNEYTENIYCSHRPFNTGVDLISTGKPPTYSTAKMFLSSPLPYVSFSSKNGVTNTFWME